MFSFAAGWSPSLLLGQPSVGRVVFQLVTGGQGTPPSTQSTALVAVNLEEALAIRIGSASAVPMVAACAPSLVGARKNAARTKLSLML